MNVPPGGPALLKSVTYSLLIFALISNALLIIYVNFMYAQLSARADSLRAQCSVSMNYHLWIMKDHMESHGIPWDLGRATQRDPPARTTTTTRTTRTRTRTETRLLETTCNLCYAITHPVGLHADLSWNVDKNMMTSSTFTVGMLFFGLLIRTWWLVQPSV